MTRKRVLWIIFLSGFILLVSSIGTSYFWITKIYLPEHMDINGNSKLLMKWEQEDQYSPPENGQITREQLSRFLLVNESLIVVVQKLRRHFEENSWSIAFAVIKVQPEWIGKKYLALKKCELSPKEYNWISNCVTDFWIYRWKEESIDRLRGFGWSLENYNLESKRPPNYDLFFSYEKDLNRIFDILWPDKEAKPEAVLTDSLGMN
jgi:hypothetical protein